VRPGIVAGPFDDTDRFTYWCVRASKGGEFVAPDDPERPVQFIDARDLAAFSIKASEDSLHGVFNATGPQRDELGWGEFLRRCVAVAAGGAQPVWVPERVLRDAGVDLGRELPLYAPRYKPGFATVDFERAVAAGLEFSPLERTIEDTLRWGLEDGHELTAGMTQGREKEILEAQRRSRL
jgi:2'-hydroxyisoflavone reductase